MSRRRIVRVAAPRPPSEPSRIAVLCQERPALVAACAAGSAIVIGAVALLLRRRARQRAARYFGQRDAAGLPHGLGACLSPEGDVLDRQCGTWNAGRLEREGAIPLSALPVEAPLSAKAAGASLLYPSGGVYRGEYNADFQAHGAGTLLRFDGAVLSGNFANDEQRGAGSIQWADGARCDCADFQAGGGICGTVRFVYPDGNVYEGEFLHDQHHGLGAMWSAKKKMLACGKWEQGELVQGRAVPLSVIPVGSALRAAAKRADLLTPDGGWYVGGTNTDGLPDGTGTLFFPNGSEMAHGTWRAGLQYGRGRVCESGEHYDGELDAGRMHGLGCYTGADGAVFEGQFQQGQPSGFGAQWDAQGKLVACGRYVAGKQAERCPIPMAVLPQRKRISEAGQGADLLFPDGSWYTGSLNKENQPHGEGVKCDASGTVVRRGMWTEGNATD